MGKRVCAGVLALSILVSLAVLPAAVVRLVHDVRALVTFDFRVATVEAR